MKMAIWVIFYFNGFGKSEGNKKSKQSVIDDKIKILHDFFMSSYGEIAYHKAKPLRNVF